MSEEPTIKCTDSLKATVTKTQDPFPKVMLTPKRQFLNISWFGDYTTSCTPRAS